MKCYEGIGKEEYGQILYFYANANYSCGVCISKLYMEIARVCFGETFYLFLCVILLKLKAFWNCINKNDTISECFFDIIKYIFGERI